MEEVVAQVEDEVVREVWGGPEGYQEDQGDLGGLFQALQVVQAEEVEV